MFVLPGIPSFFSHSGGLRCWLRPSPPPRPLLHACRPLAAACRDRDERQGGIFTGLNWDLFDFFSLQISISRLSLAHPVTGRKRNLLRPRAVVQEMGEEMAASALAAMRPLRRHRFGTGAKTNVSRKRGERGEGLLLKTAVRQCLLGLVI